MVRDQLLAILNQNVKIAPFPHEWDDFRLMSVGDDDVAVFFKRSTPQRFVVPIKNIVAIHGADTVDRAVIEINRPVRWERDWTGYGNIWKI